MPNLALQLKGEFTNVTRLVPAEGVDAAILLQIECTSCHEKHPKLVAIEPSNVVEMQKSRGSANLIVNCPSCRRENSASFVVRKPGSKDEGKMGEVAPWSEIDMSAGPDWHTLCTVEFRGMQPIDPSIQELLTDSSSWKCVGTESGTPFTDVQFEDGEWHDYDEKAGEEVRMTDIELRWQRV